MKRAWFFSKRKGPPGRRTKFKHRRRLKNGLLEEEDDDDGDFELNPDDFGLKAGEK
jgi:hypothetical protein